MGAPTGNVNLNIGGFYKMDGGVRTPSFGAGTVVGVGLAQTFTFLLPLCPCHPPCNLPLVSQMHYYWTQGLSQQHSVSRADTKAAAPDSTIILYQILTFRVPYPISILPQLANGGTNRWLDMWSGPNGNTNALYLSTDDPAANGTKCIAGYCLKSEASAT